VVSEKHFFFVTFVVGFSLHPGIRNHVKTTNDVEDEDNSDEDIADDFGVVNQENFMEEGMARSLTKILILMNLSMG
jgi:hypothetical protein